MSFFMTQCMCERVVWCLWTGCLVYSVQAECQLLQLTSMAISKPCCLLTGSVVNNWPTLNAWTVAAWIVLYFMLSITKLADIYRTLSTTLSVFVLLALNTHILVTNIHVQFIMVDMLWKYVYKWQWHSRSWPHPWKITHKLRQYTCVF